MIALVSAMLLAGVGVTWCWLVAPDNPSGQRITRGVARMARLPAALMARVLRPPQGVTAHGWLAVLLAILVPVLVVLALPEPAPEDTWRAPARERDHHIARLLQGERLVPPPALPPAMFTTREVERIRPELRGADRRWDKLDAEFAQRLLQVFAIMRHQHGYELVLLEGYRSPERQQQLAAMGPHVTNAGMYQSWHQYGLAADVAFLRDGRVVISERDPWAMRGYTLYGEVAESLGLTWGGRWRMRDYGHVELRRTGARRPPVDASL